MIGIEKNSLLRVRIAQTVHELDALRRQWEFLEKESSSTIFQSFAWNRLAIEVFSSRISPYVIFAENSSGATLIPAGINPVSRQVCLLGDELFDYRDVLCHGNFSECLPEAWRALSKLQLPLAPTIIRGECVEHWEPFLPQFFCQAPFLKHENADNFASRHPRLGRQIRRLTRAGAAYKTYTGGNSQLLRFVYESKAKQFKGNGNNIFADPARIQFMLAAAALPSSGCLIFALETFSDLVAALVTFNDRSARRFYTTYYDPHWAGYSPGIALLFESTRISLEAGLVCDYMTGEQPHKVRLATSCAPLFSVSATPSQMESVTRELQTAR